MGFDIPKVFWKYFDLYRRKLITLREYARLSGIEEEVLVSYLNVVGTNQRVTFQR